MSCTGCYDVGVPSHLFCPVCMGRGNDYEVRLWEELNMKGMLSSSAPLEKPKRTWRSAAPSGLEERK